MLRNLNSLRGCTLAATDGDIGKVREMYFDDAHWTMRYLVVTAGSWLTGRDVLITPQALGAVDAQSSEIQVKLTQEQVRQAPSIDTDKPVSRQYEELYYQHYGWQPYWLPPGPETGAWIPPPIPPPEATEAVEDKDPEPKGDQHLRSSQAMRHEGVRAQDGEVGQVSDFILDDSDWRIRYLVIDTGNWLPGKHVLLAPNWIEKIGASAGTVFVNLPRSTIEAAPEYDKNVLIDRAYEQRLHDHYQHKAYWAAVDQG